MGEPEHIFEFDSADMQGRAQSHIELSTIRHTKSTRTFYNRIKDSNPNGKAVSVTVMKKLPVMLYTVCKNKKMYGLQYGKDK